MLINLRISFVVSLFKLQFSKATDLAITEKFSIKLSKITLNQGEREEHAPLPCQ